MVLGFGACYRFITPAQGEESFHRSEGTTELSERSDFPGQDEIAEALRAAIEVLGAAFSDTEGSGRDALLKCRKALKTLKPSVAAVLPPGIAPPFKKKAG